MENYIIDIIRCYEEEMNAINRYGYYLKDVKEQTY
jgi:hypothetical protein